MSDNKPKVSILTICMDRLFYTKQTMEQLWKNETTEYDHYIIDNGSTDGTIKYLEENKKKFKKIIRNDENVGLHVNFKQFMEEAGDYDYYFKLDNDCLLLHPETLKELIEASEEINDSFILSPRVEGIFKQPERATELTLAGHPLGIVTGLGGISMFMPKKIVKNYQHNVNAEKYKGLDSAICVHAIRHGFNIGYLEDISVMHIENTRGQQKRYPQYFIDKKK